MSIQRFSTTLSVAAITTLTCVGCASYAKLDPGTTLGKIEVSGVRVSSRERMVNERLKRREFLEAQLKAAESLTATDFAEDGGFTVRSVSGFGAGLGQSVDADTAKLSRLGKARDAQRLRNQQEMDAWDRELLLAIREKLLTEVKDGKTPPEQARQILSELKVVGSEASKPNDSKSPDLTDSVKWRNEISNLLKASTDLPTGFQPAAGRSSPIDLFRDKLALLEEIRSEIAANELDDRHDLYGSTVIRLSVDATLIPEHDTSTWGVVEMQIKPVFDEKLFKENEFIDRLNDLATERMLRAKRQYVKACYGNNSEVDRDRTIGNVVARFAFTNRKIDAKSKFRTGDAPPLKDISDHIGKALQKMRTGTAPLSLCNRKFENDDLIPLVSSVFHAEILTSSLTLPGHSIDLYDTLTLQKLGKNAYRLVKRVDNKVGPTPLQSWLDEAFATIKTLPYVYAATPKEQVQRISQSGSRRDAMELMLALQAVSGAGSASGAISMMQANEVIFSALHRQPLVVGYSGSNGEYRRVGWVLGPRFKVEQDYRGRPQFGFRHRIVQNTLNAEVVVPQFATSVEVTTCVGWRDERETGAPAEVKGTCPAGMTAIGRDYVALPQNPEALAEAFDPDARRPFPELYARRLVPQGVAAAPKNAAVDMGATGSSQRSVLMLQGANLWRNPQVFVGGIKASGVLVLSDMRGIQATFDVPPTDLTDCTADRGITVVTSTGSVDFGPAGQPCNNNTSTKRTPSQKTIDVKATGRK